MSLLTTAHDSGFWRLAEPYQTKGFHLQSSADLPRRTACPLCMYFEKNRRLAYKRFVAVGIDEETAAFYSDGKHSPVRGDEDFCQAVLKGRVTNIDVPELRQMRSLPSIEQIALLTANHYGVAEDQLWHSTRGRGVKSPARSVAMYLCQEVASKSLSEIAAGFNLASYASTGSSIRSVRLKLTEDPWINDSVRLIKLDLTR